MKSINRGPILLLIVVIAVSVIVSSFVLFSKPQAPEPIIKEIIVPVPGLTIIKAPEQKKAEWPDAFPNPRGNWVAMPDGPNLAEGKPVDSGEVTEVYAAVNIVDGSTNTYWESKGFPAEITIDLQSVLDIQTVGIRLNPSPIWEPRKQTFEILVSTDGVAYSTAVPETQYEFDPETGNIVRVDFDSTSAQYVRLLFTANTAGRSNGSQAAEIEVYGATND